MLRRQALGLAQAMFGADAALEFSNHLKNNFINEFIGRRWTQYIDVHISISRMAKDKDRLVFVEVKTRSGSGFGHPFEAITANKVARMRRLVADWCIAKQVSGAKVRLDAIAVLVTAGRVHIEHLKEVF